MPVNRILQAWGLIDYHSYHFTTHSASRFPVARRRAGPQYPRKWRRPSSTPPSPFPLPPPDDTGRPDCCAAPLPGGGRKLAAQGQRFLQMVQSVCGMADGRFHHRQIIQRCHL